jgi:DNA polymerase-3 subunit delta
VQIDDGTLRYFIECCGTNMQDLINEIRKLIEYAGENGKIQKEDIDKLTIKKLESIIFDLTDNLGKKEIAKALEVLNNLIYAKEPIQKILITLYNHFKKLYLTKTAIENNQNIAEVLNLKPNQIFLTSKYKSQSSYFTKQELKNILDEFILLDQNSKIGLIDVNIGLEAILSKYCS